MLFTTTAMISSINDPVATGINTYINPNSCIFSLPITAINAVAPPGGWSVRVSCMTIIEVATAKAEQNQMFPEKSLKAATPIIADNICPPIRFRGWDRGEFTAPYIRTALAPNEPITRLISESLKISKWIYEIARIPRNEPIQDQIIFDFSMGSEFTFLNCFKNFFMAATFYQYKNIIHESWPILLLYIKKSYAYYFNG